MKRKKKLNNLLVLTAGKKASGALLLEIAKVKVQLKKITLGEICSPRRQLCLSGVWFILAFGSIIKG